MTALVASYGSIHPRIASDAFIAPNATVIGDVEIGAAASLWFNVVLRGDVNSIRIGASTNIQDGTVVHVTTGVYPTIIGARVTVGHACIIHGCTLEDDSFVGMGTIILDGAVVEGNGVVAAGALVPPGKCVRRGELWMGRPAKPVRTLSAEEQKAFSSTWQRYVARGREYSLALPR